MSGREVSLAQRRSSLLTALTMLEVDWPTQEPPVVSALREYFGSWDGIGAVIAGMERQEFDLELVREDRRGWRATWYITGRVHSFTSSTGSAFERTLARAIQRAARDALTRVSSDTAALAPEGARRELESEQLL